MRVLVLLHGMPPQAGQAVVGTGLRAYANGEGLRLAGHEIFYCTRTEDLPEGLRGDAEALRGPQKAKARLGHLAQAEGDSLPRGKGLDASGLAPAGGPLGAPGNPLSFTDAGELKEVVDAVAPDLVLLEAPEEAERLPDGSFVVVVDLFAPRILEQQFQSAGDEREAVRALNALHRGDFFLFSNERQRYYFLPLLALAGIDCTEEVGAVVPISCPPSLPKITTPKLPVFVSGGVFWPWADLSQGLASLLSILDEGEAGKIHLYGGEYGIRSDTVSYIDPRDALPKKSKRLTFKGMVPIDTLWANYTKGSVAFDLMVPNPERDLNLSFRQIDYLRCGLPIITAPRQVLSPALEEYGAGWCIEPGDHAALQELVAELVAEPQIIAKAAEAAQRLAKDRFFWNATTQPLVEFAKKPVRRNHGATVIGRMASTQGRLWGEHEENKRLRNRVEHLDGDLGKKTDEIQGLNKRLSVLLGSVDRLSGSISEVSRFKNSTLKYLHEAQDDALREAGELTAELERRALDVEKKDSALKRMQREVKKLKGSVKQLKSENKNLETKYVSRDAESIELENERKALEDRLRGAEEDLRRLRKDIGKKNREMEETAARLDKQQSRAELALETGEKERLLLRDVRQKMTEAEETLRTQGRDLEDQRAKAEELNDRLREAEYQHQELLRELAKKERELEEAQTSATNTQVSLDSSLEVLRERLGRVEYEGRVLLKELQKKENEIRDVQTHRDSMRDKLDGQLSSLGLEVASKDQELVTLRGMLDESRTELDAAKTDTRKKSQELDRVQAQRDETLAKDQEIGSLRTELEQELSSLRLELEKSQTDAKALKADNKKKSQELEELQVQRSEVLTKNQELGSHQDELDQELSSLRLELDQSAIQAKALEADNKKKSRELEQVQEERNQLAGLKGELEEVLHKVEALQADSEKKSQELEELQAQRSEVLTKNQELSSLQGKLDEELSSLRVELDQSGIQAKALEIDNTKKSRELEQVQEERNQLAGLKGELEEALHEVKALQADSKKKSKELEELQGERSEVLAKNLELSGLQGKLDQELSSLRVELDQSVVQAKALEADNVKKSRELEQVQEERNQLAGLKGELEEVCHEVESLRIDNKKKTQELEKTQYQRDEAVGTLRIVTKKEDVEPSEEDEEDEDG